MISPTTRVRRFLLLWLVCGALSAGPAARSRAADAPASTQPGPVALLSSPRQVAGEFTWQNPLGPILRDPQILVVDHVYYLTGTAPPFFEHLGQSPGVPLWSSKDLIHWNNLGVIVAPTAKSWYQIRFWAAELFFNPDDHRFYCTFNCPFPNPKGPQSVGLAVADKITGPYTVMTADHPLTEGNDADLFRDDDGKVYLFRSGVVAIQVDLPAAKTVGDTFPIIPKGPEGAWDGRTTGAPVVGEEGPSVRKIRGTYYLFYSSWGRGYEVGVATAKSVHGPWTRAPNNPIYGAQDQKWCKQYKHVFTQDPSIPWRQVGHNSIFTGPDGRWWICAHGLRIGDGVLQSHLVIDPLNFDGVEFQKTDVSYRPMRVKIDPKFYPPAGVVTSMH
jgi:xylan 1,4-beta-xylosidase